ncbi:MAG: NAD(P)-dependent oxidoreductase, partial [Acidobacteria bacterium]|nr:NAD(P)-dependent oxidoreductase [Acidobacteriota bacterium]
MRVLVTGATGFVGAALCEAIRSAGHVPVALSRNPKRAL